MHFIFKDPGKDVGFDNLDNLDLPGTNATFPPYIQMDNTRGSLNTGVVAYGATHQIKPTATASLSWVKGNHSYKFGGEMRIESHPNTVFTPSNGQFFFNANQTSAPGFVAGASGTGHPYASFLLGMVNNGQIGVPNRFHLGKHSIAFFAQDSWKITPKLTLDYGLRWDYQTNLQETHGRMPNFDPAVPNPDYGNLLGRLVYNKNVADVYGHAWGPRIGIAYQFMPKTVFRAGAGISYGQTGALEMWNLRMGSYVDYGPGANAYDPIGCFRNGPNQDNTPYNCTDVGWEAIQPVWPDPSAKVPRTPFSTVQPMIDRQAGRPPRQFQWSIGIQREITSNLSVDIAYVGNRGAWWNVNGAMTDPNHITPEILAAHNFSLSNADDQALLGGSVLLSSLTPAQMTAHNLTVPFSGFNGTVNQAIRPFPHVGNIFKIWSKNGRTWYDSLQVKVTKRYSHGLDFSAAYSWQKESTIGVETNDTAFNTPPAINNIDDFWSNKTISGYSIPHRIVIGANYRLPKLNINQYASWILRDWTIGTILTYQTGLPIMAPKGSNNIGSVLKLCSAMGVLGGCNGSLFNANSSASYATRVEGQPLFLVEPNSGFDPFTNFMLNKAAWTSAPNWQYGTGAPYYSDYRYRRRPSENMSFGRVF